MPINIKVSFYILLLHYFPAIKSIQYDKIPPQDICRQIFFTVECKKIPLEKPLVIQTCIIKVGDESIYSWDMLEFQEVKSKEKSVREFSFIE